MKIDGITHEQTKKFAEACFEQNAIHELVIGLYQKHADKTDCNEWNITPSQWRDAIFCALMDKCNTASELE